MAQGEHSLRASWLPGRRSLPVLHQCASARSAWGRYGVCRPYDVRCCCRLPCRSSCYRPVRDGHIGPFAARVRSEYSIKTAHESRIFVFVDPMPHARIIRASALFHQPPFSPTYRSIYVHPLTHSPPSSDLRTSNVHFHHRQQHPTKYCTFSHTRRTRTILGPPPPTPHTATPRQHEIYTTVVILHFDVWQP